MTDRKFYKTIVKFEVLSGEPIPPGMEYENIVHECKEGEWSMRSLGEKKIVLNGKQAAKALTLQGSDPSFFCLDDKGNDADL